MHDLVVHPQGWGMVFIRAAKNDAEQAGHRAYAARDTVAILQHWLARAGISRGSLLRHVPKGGRVRSRLHPS